MDEGLCTYIGMMERVGTATPLWHSAAGLKRNSGKLADSGCPSDLPWYYAAPLAAAGKARRLDRHRALVMLGRVIIQLIRTLDMMLR